MKPSDTELLETAGWDIECLSPLELRHRESGSFASLLAADFVLQGLRAEQAGSDSDVLAANVVVTEFAQLLQRLFNFARTAESVNTEMQWEDTYNLIFSAVISHRLNILLGHLGHTLDYYDPDTSYEEDVRAYVAAWRDKLKLLKAHYSEFEAVTP